jgi:four helix bundle protein
MSEIRSFRDLDAWQAAKSLAVRTYEVAGHLPASERFELGAQMRRAAVSIPSNVAEGQAFGRGARNRHHVRIALGSWAELVTHFELLSARRVVDPTLLAEMDAEINRTGKLLHGLLRSLRLQATVKAIVTLLFIGGFSLYVFG